MELLLLLLHILFLFAIPDLWVSDNALRRPSWYVSLILRYQVDFATIRTGLYKCVCKVEPMERNVTSTNTSKKQELKTLEEKLMMKDEQLFNQLVDLLNSNHIQIDLLEEQPFVVCSKEKEVEVCHSLMLSFL